MIARVCACDGKGSASWLVRGWLSLVIFGVCSLAAVEAGHAQDLRQSELQAGFLLNFLRFTTWPATCFESPDSPVVVTVIGADIVAEDLAVISSEERLGPEGRPVVVRRRNGVDPIADGAGRPGRGATARDLHTSHLVFVGEPDALHVDWILGQLAEKPVLTVGDAPGFADAGGMLGLVVRSGRMTFDANREQIVRAGIAISSKVLRLARLVGTEVG